MRNMIVPLIILIGLIPPLFLWTGGYPENDFMTAIAESDGGMSILIAALVATLVALLMGVQQKLFSLKESIDIIVEGFKSMMLVYIILALAWSIGSVTTELGTAEYVVAAAEANATTGLIPALLFIVASIIAFTTGTSYGTFAIMMPIAIPVAASMDISMGLAIATVFSGGIFGDHCSPISDTTILSSAGSSCDHIDHVNTQIPYAILAGISGLVAFLVAGFTGSGILALVIGAVILVVAAYVLNRTWGHPLTE